MIRRLYDIHQGATIAVVSSGPSATAYYPYDSDYAIGVNGAALLAQRGTRLDYFLCGSQHSPQRPWFAIDCAWPRIICVRFAWHDRYLYPNALYPDLERQSYPDVDIDAIRLPAPPYLAYRYTRDPSAVFFTGAPVRESGDWRHYRLGGGTNRLPHGTCLTDVIRLS